MKGIGKFYHWRSKGYEWRWLEFGLLHWGFTFCVPGGWLHLAWKRNDKPFPKWRWGIYIWYSACGCYPKDSKYGFWVINFDSKWTELRP